jgi:hypothetical protein
MPCTQDPHHRNTAGPALAWLAALLLACAGSGGGSSGSAAPPATTALAARPASTAKVTILTPRNGQTVHSPTPRGPPRPQRRQDRPPDQYPHPARPGPRPPAVDGKLVAMNYGLNEQLPNLGPGQHLVQVEFVAADHAPFEPRVLAQAAFNITP